MTRLILLIAACAAVPAQASTIFTCSNDRVRAQFMIDDDGDWFQRASSRYAWRTMNCSRNGNECSYGRRIHVWSKHMSGGMYSIETLYENSGRWISESNFGTGHQTREGHCEVEEGEG